MTYRAIRTARDLARRNVDIGEGLCVLRVREAMGITEPTGDQDGDRDADAVDAWLRTVHKRFETDRLLRGAWVYFRPLNTTRHGHAAIATGYGRGDDATVWSPGTPAAPRRWRKIAVGQLEAGWGLRLVGYGLDLNGHPVPDLERG